MKSRVGKSAQQIQFRLLLPGGFLWQQAGSSLPPDAVPTGTAIARHSGPNGMGAIIADEAPVLVGSELLKIRTRGAVGTPQYQDGIRQG